jgi:hypothetical protein
MIILLIYLWFISGSVALTCVVVIVVCVYIMCFCLPPFVSEWPDQPLYKFPPCLSLVGLLCLSRFGLFSLCQGYVT